MNINNNKETDHNLLLPAPEVGTIAEQNFTQSKTKNKRKSCMDSPIRTVKESKGSGSTKDSDNYLPTFRSGGYAILMTLHKNNSMQFNVFTFHFFYLFEKIFSHNLLPAGQMTKMELQKEAQELCDTPFTRSSKSGSYYTAWSSMSLLIKKGLVESNSRPAR